MRWVARALAGTASIRGCGGASDGFPRGWDGLVPVDVAADGGAWLLIVGGCRARSVRAAAAGVLRRPPPAGTPRATGRAGVVRAFPCNQTRRYLASVCDCSPARWSPRLPECLRTPPRSRTGDALSSRDRPPRRRSRDASPRGSPGLVRMGTGSGAHRRGKHGQHRRRLPARPRPVGARTEQVACPPDGRAPLGGGSRPV